MEKLNWCEDLHRKTGKSKQWIYRVARRLGRKPTVKDLTNVKKGRPSIY